MSAIVHTPTNGTGNSRRFYEQLGYQQIDHSDLILYTDGKVVLEVNPDRMARAGIKLFQSSWEKELEALKDLTPVTEFEGGYLLGDPSGVWIYLIRGESPVSLPVAGASFSVLGNYMGLSLETTDFIRSQQIYEALGFQLEKGGAGQGWASLNRAGFGISLMPPFCCPHLFFNPSLTYFNGTRNVEVIGKVRELGIPIAEEITHFNKEGLVDNIIIRDPGGYGFFIFSD